jgi:hypothetical protein
MPNYRNAPRYTVTRTPAAGGPPATDSALEVLRMHHSTGADRLDYADLEVNLAATGGRIQEWTDPPYIGDEIEITDAGGTVLHWGKIAAVHPHISPRGESLTLVSRVELFHMGRPVDAIYMYDPAVNTHGLVDAELVFNPLIDGIAQGNRNAVHTVAPLGLPLFIDPESCRSAAAVTYQENSVGSASPINQFWTLRQAIRYLLWALNGDEEYINNPSLAQIDAEIDNDALPMQNVRLERGLYLGQCLDRLLVPAGYLWRINYSPGGRTLSFFRRGAVGSLVSIPYQAYGETLNTVLTKAEAIDLKFDAARLANQVEVRGSRREFEITAELARAWPEDDDGKVVDELLASGDDFASVRNVYRKWVLNEAGDYIGLRSELTDIFTSAIRTAMTTAGILAQFRPARRRRLLPTLTLGADGATPIGPIRGIEIEMSNPLFGTGGPEWIPLPNISCELLEHEAGIYITAEALPEEFELLGTDLKLRVTATLESSYRIAYNAVRQVASPQPDVARTVLELIERYRYREVTSLSKYYDDVNGMTPTKASLQANDYDAMVDYADFARTTWDLLDVGGKIVLEGLDHSYSVGQRVQTIEGRDISLQAKSASGAYPQIVAIERNVTSQNTILHLQRVSDRL